MDEQMTVIKALEVTKNLLTDIPVRIADMDSIGAPIRAAVGNLNAIMEALRKKEQEMPKEEADNDS